MSNRVIKVSILIIFMMFVTGLFNFCFAEEITTYPWISEEFSNVTREDNVVSFNYLGKDYSITIDSAYNYKYYAVVYNGGTSSLRILTSDYPYSSQIWKSGYSHTLNMCTHSSFVVDENNVASQYNQGSSLAQTAFNCSKITYKFNGSNWVKDSSTSMKAGGSYTYSATNATISDSGDVFLYCDNNIKYHDSTYDYLYYANSSPSIDMEINQTGSRTGHVTFIPKNYDGSMYYIKGDKDTLDSLVANANISKNDSNVNYYSGPIYIEENEYVLGLIFDDYGNVIFSKTSETIEYDPDFIFNDSHCLRLEQDDMDTYYLFIHSPQERRLY